MARPDDNCSMRSQLDSSRPVRCFRRRRLSATLLGGAGAAVATVGIFLPSFFHVALLAPVFFRLRQSPWIGAFMVSGECGRGCAYGGSDVSLGADALRAWQSWAIAISSLIALFRWKLTPAWVVLGGGIAGLLLATVGG